MIKMMPISHQQAFLLGRNNYNWKWSAGHWYALPPFYYDGITPIGVYTVSEFKLRKITIKGATKTVDNTEAISSALVLWARGTNSDTFYFPSKTRISITEDTGLCELYVKLSNDEEYISEPFWWVNCGETPAVVGDYANASPNDDYNHDYWK